MTIGIHRPARRQARLAMVMPLTILSLGSTLAAGVPAGTVINNVGLYEDSNGHSLTANANLTVGAVCNVNLLPPSQRISNKAGEPQQLQWTIEQLGNGSFPLTVNGTAIFSEAGSNPGNPSPITIEVLNADGTVSTQGTNVSISPAPLDQNGQIITIRTTRTLATAGEEQIKINVGCANQAPATATAIIGAGLLPPTANKVLSATGQEWTRDGTVAIGDHITYTITLTNPNKTALNGITLEDPLDSEAMYVSATPAPSSIGESTGSAEMPDRGAGGINVPREMLRWTNINLAAGETRTFEVTTRVKENTPDGATIANAARSDDGRNQVDTPTVLLNVFSTRLMVTKNVGSEALINPGSVVEYKLTVTNPSNLAVSDVRFNDRPDPKLIFVHDGMDLNGTQTDAILNIGGQGETAVSLDVQPIENAPAGSYRMISPSFTLAPGGTATLRYTMRLPLENAGNFENIVFATGINKESQVQGDVTSNEDKVIVQTASVTGQQGYDIAGRVYIDRDNNQKYNPEIDQPLNLARITLGGGREALTDKQGRYSFLNVKPGFNTLLLDPTSIPGYAQPTPYSMGMRGGAALNIRGGIALQDFPVYTAGGNAGLTSVIETPTGPISLQWDSQKVRIATTDQNVCATLRDDEGNSLLVSPGWTTSKWNIATILKGIQSPCTGGQ